MKDISECIGEIVQLGSTIFSTIDLTASFWQMILHPWARTYTAFTVPAMGQFQWVPSPMGLLGCPASFQRLMKAVVNGISNVIIYIDDLLVH
jgi:Reverse transcriptase (RNA-dependent DNA polymerase)